MTQRLFFLPQTEKKAIEVVTWLKAHVSEKDIHVLARQDKKLLSEELPNAELQETSDIKSAAARGAAIGGVLFAGLAAVVIPPIGAIATAGVIAGGAVLGSWSSTLIGVSVPNENLDEFSDAIDKGAVLVFADIPDDKLELIEGDIANKPVISTLYKKSKQLDA